MILRKENGFTLIELIVVIAIIAILAAIIAPNAFKVIRKSQVAKTVSDMKALKTALLGYYADTGSFPDPFYFRTDGYGHRNIGCGSYSFHSPPLIANEENIAGWDGPYLENVVRSPLVHEYVSGGFTYPGVYWIGGTQCYRHSFDLDSDGTIDVTNAVSVQLAGLSLEDALAIDAACDGDGGRSGNYGIMHVYPWTGYYFVYYYVGAGD